MRYRIAQIVVLAAAFLTADEPLLHAQVVPCRPSRASIADDKQSSSLEISINEVTFSGSLQLPISEQEQIAASIKLQTYGDSDEAIDEAGERVKAGWQNRGYLKAQVSVEERLLTSSPANQRIALSVNVEEGLQYTLGGIRFKNNRAITDIDALRGLFPIDNGDIFSREKIATGLDNLRDAYGSMGYINFVPVPETTFDDEKRLIFLDIDIDEGKQFYISNINVLGLDESARQELLNDLPIKIGQVYTSRVWEPILLKYGSELPDCECRERLHMDYRAGTAVLSLDFRPCSE